MSFLVPFHSGTAPTELPPSHIWVSFPFLEDSVPDQDQNSIVSRTATGVAIGPSLYEVTTATTHSCVVPVELVYKIFLSICERDTCASLSTLYASRYSILRASREFRSIAMNIPALWDTILVDHRTTYGSLKACLAMTKGRKFQLEIRAAEMSKFTGRGLRSSFPAFIGGALQLIAPFFGDCERVLLQAQSDTLIKAILKSFAGLKPNHLLTIVTCFGLDQYREYDPHAFNRFHFQTAPVFGLLYPPVSALVLATTEVCAPYVIYTSGQATSSFVTCPEDEPPSWFELNRLLSYCPTVETLTLHKISCGALPMFTSMPAPLPLVHTLELEFGGRFQMAELVARLVLPGLVTVKFVVDCEADMACVSHCRAVLGTAYEVVIIGRWMEATGFRYLFRLMYRTEVLDLSHSTLEFWADFCAASLFRPTVGFNTYACPRLQHIVPPRMPLGDVRDLLMTRRFVGYRDVRMVTMGKTLGIGLHDPQDISWFSNQGIALRID